MFPWHSTIASGGVPPPSGPSTGRATDSAYEALQKWLASAPRDPEGRLTAPAAMLQALPPLSKRGAGMLLAICDIKGMPSRDEFARCLEMAPEDAGNVPTGRPPAQPPVPIAASTRTRWRGRAAAGQIAPDRTSTAVYMLALTCEPIKMIFFRCRRGAL